MLMPIMIPIACVLLAHGLIKALAARKKLSPELMDAVHTIYIAAFILLYCLKYVILPITVVAIPWVGFALNALLLAIHPIFVGSMVFLAFKAKRMEHLNKHVFTYYAEPVLFMAVSVYILFFRTCSVI